MSFTREELLAEENRRLRQKNEALRSEKLAFQTQVKELESIRRNLEHTVAVYRRCLFGSRSEKLDPKELSARIAKAAAGLHFRLCSTELQSECRRLDRLQLIAGLAGEAVGEDVGDEKMHAGGHRADLFHQ
jgi:hypothetical protein